MKKKCIFLMGILLFIFCNNQTADALENYELNFKAYHINSCDISSTKKAEQCMISALSGEMEEQAIKNFTVETGENIMVLVQLNVPLDSQLYALSFDVKVNPSQLNFQRLVINDNAEAEYAIFPYNEDEEETTWTISFNKNLVRFSAYDSKVMTSQAMPIVKSGTLFALFYTVNSTMENESISIEIVEISEQYVFANNNLEDITENVITNPIQFSIISQGEYIPNPMSNIFFMSCFNVSSFEYFRKEIL